MPGKLGSTVGTTVRQACSQPHIEDARQVLLGATKGLSQTLGCPCSLHPCIHSLVWGVHSTMCVECLLCTEHKPKAKDRNACEQVPVGPSCWSLL